MHQHRKRKYVNSAEHENAKKRMRKHNIVAYSNIVGTPEHEVRKAKMRQTYSSIVGTPEHELIKEKMRQYRTETYSNIVGTPEHELVKEKMRQYRTETYSNI